MKRKIIRIDKEKCNGCGLCVNACHEGAIGLINGKAELLRDDYCDGLGACLPICPVNAIDFEEREAAAFDEKAIERNAPFQQINPEMACPGRTSHAIEHSLHSQPDESAFAESALMQWPVQLQLAPIQASYYKDAHLLIAADCTAYSYAGFHGKLMRNRITLIGCPKLDEADYSKKLAAIIAQNDIRSVKVVRMEVPCCGGLENAVKQALIQSGKMIPWQVVVISTDGKILSE